MKASAGKMKRILIIVENLPVPFDRRVWQEAKTLKNAGYQVSVICPRTKGFEAKYEFLEGIHIYRHKLPIEAKGAIGYMIEYSAALFWQCVLAWKILLKHGFDVIHACNPPDTIFLVGLPFKLLGKKFVFDHHDINPELYLAKFGKKDLFYKMLLALERLTFWTADISIATNESYKEIAIKRGQMNSGRVFVVRSGPNIDRLKILPPDEKLKKGRKYLVGYVGVMGKQEGIDYLLRAIKHIIVEMNRKDVHFGLVGSGPALESLKDYTEELGLSDYVTFTGRVPDKDMLEMLNTADVCVNPDVANQMNDLSTMNKVMEYMALGKPIVQFDLKEGRFSAQKASLYAERNNEIDLALKIIQLLDDPDLRQEMGRYGRNRIQDELAWKYEEPKLLAAYEALWH
ncbi:MAG: glycosyltransferase family 4 protein [Planctomycetes bacterium]|nr:glycosyltransferase family 4 protein [Planctomycetota bacterium]